GRPVACLPRDPHPPDSDRIALPCSLLGCRSCVRAWRMPGLGGTTIDNPHPVGGAWAGLRLHRSRCPQGDNETVGGEVFPASCTSPALFASNRAGALRAWLHG